MGSPTAGAADAADAVVPTGPPPVFIVGSDRSGTTLLRLYLDASSELAIPNESWFLIPLLERFPRDRPLERAEALEAIAVATGHRRFEQGWSADPDALADAVAQRAPLPLAALIDLLFRAEIAPTGKRRWGDKTPEYLFHVDALADLFPEARFVCLVRDGRDVCLSLIRARFRDRGWTPYRVGRYWRRCAEAGARLERRLGPDRLQLLRYEDLVLHTRRELERLCGWLELPFDAAMLDPHARALTKITDAERRMGIHAKLARAPRPSDVARWRRERSLPLALASGFLGDGLRRYGYPDPPREGRARLLRAAARIDDLAWRVRRRARRRAIRFAATVRRRG